MTVYSVQYVDYKQMRLSILNRRFLISSRVARMLAKALVEIADVMDKVADPAAAIAAGNKRWG